jgi:phosphonate transport system substrate-binding protein
MVFITKETRLTLLPRTLASAFIACMTWSAAFSALAGQANSAALTFGAISPRSAVITAQYWNPILRHISQQSGVPIKLKLAKNSLELASMIRRGELDFIYSNYQFAPDSDSRRYKVIARPLASPVRSQIVVPADSFITSLDQLRGRDVVFASKVAFAGYHLPIDALLRAGIKIKPAFAGTVEGALGQMLSGRVAAAGVSAVIASDYAERQRLAYRVLWSSEEYPAVPIAAHTAVPKDKVEAVRTALLSMADNQRGREILANSAPLFGRMQPRGFVAADDTEYENVRRFYKRCLVLQENP